MKLREGFRVRGKFHLFLLFLLLESSWLVYLGVLAGTIFGLCWIHDPAKGWDDPLFLPVIGGGAVRLASSSASSGAMRLAASCGSV